MAHQGLGSVSIFTRGALLVAGILLAAIGCSETRDFKQKPDKCQASTETDLCYKCTDENC